MHQKILLTLLILLVLGGCSKQEVRPYQDRSFAPTIPSTVDILYSFPNQAHLKIGAVSVRKYKPGFGEPSVEDAHEMLQNAGAELGAHAVVVISTEAAGETRQRHVQAEAIRWKE